jgi:hypothetical protein
MARSLGLLALLAGCPYVGGEGWDRARDVDGDGVISNRFEGGRDCDDNDRNVLDCDVDRDGFPALGFGTDCDDTRFDVNPDAVELCTADGNEPVDEDCDGRIDDLDDVEPASRRAWYVDTDGDGFGGGDPVLACAAPVGSVDNNLDCDDSSSAISPAADERCDAEDRDCDGDPVFDAVDAVDWYTDADGDGAGRSDGFLLTACTAPADAAPLDPAGLGDCDDGDATRHPAAREACNAVDDDCDGAIDAADADVVLDIWYLDADGDGVGLGSAPMAACGQPVDHVPDPGDCNDDDANVLFFFRWVIDGDGDGYGDETPGAPSLEQCGQPEGYVRNADDCDDSIASVNAVAQELCNGFDDNCDGLADDDDPFVAAGYPWYYDLDRDGFGVVSAAPDGPTSPRYACSLPEGPWTGLSGDCDDSTTAVSPVIPERCNGLDDNCDELIDDDAVDRRVWFTDGDGDLFGASGTGELRCPEDPELGALNASDCDDGDLGRNPAAPEICDGVDNDCDGLVDDADNDVAFARWFLDGDDDGVGLAGVFVESCVQPSGFTSASGDCDDDDPEVQVAVAFVPSDFPTVAEAAQRVCAGGAVLLDPDQGPYPVAGQVTRELLIASEVSGVRAEICPAGPGPMVVASLDADITLLDLSVVTAGAGCGPVNGSLLAASLVRAVGGASMRLDHVDLLGFGATYPVVSAVGARVELTDVRVEGAAGVSTGSPLFALLHGQVDVQGLAVRDVQRVVLQAVEPDELRVVDLQALDVTPSGSNAVIEASGARNGLLRNLDILRSGTALNLDDGTYQVNASRLIGFPDGAPPARFCRRASVEVYSTTVADADTPIGLGVPVAPCSTMVSSNGSSYEFDGGVFAHFDNSVFAQNLSVFSVSNSLFLQVGSAGTHLASFSNNGSSGGACPGGGCTAIAAGDLRFALYDPTGVTVPSERWLLGPRPTSELIGVNRAPLASDIGLTGGALPQDGWVFFDSPSVVLADEDADGLPDTWETVFSGTPVGLAPGDPSPPTGPVVRTQLQAFNGGFWPMESGDDWWPLRMEVLP